MTRTEPPPPASALQSFLTTHPLPTNATHTQDLHNLTLQIAHNLHYQHLWTSLRFHTTSPQTALLLPRPMISGIPPTRLYVHPDEQIELLQKQKDEGKTGMPELSREREWVLPSHLREKWSLRRFGEVFDTITTVPTGVWEGEELFDEKVTEASKDEGQEEGKDSVGGNDEASKWRTTLPKRLLLATLDDDSTVVYYIVHDGIVKPRQN